MEKGVKFFLRFAILTVMLFGLSCSVLAYNCWTADNNQTLCQQHSSECRWNDPWCNILDCWSFGSQTECNTNTSALGLSCTWKQSNWGWCEKMSCYSFDGTNETSCESDSDAYSLNCEWSNFCQGAGTGASCWSLTTESTCEATSGCKWGSCYETGCWSYAASNACSGDSRCTWDSTYNYCTESGCWRYLNSTTCNANAACRWGSSSSSCTQKSCPTFDYNQTACVNGTVAGRNCKWVNPRCEEVGCMNYNDQTACQAATGMNCTWKSSSGGWCQKPMCDDYGQINGGSQSACENNNVNLTCKWNNGWCFVDMTTVNCANYTTEQGCMDSMYCWWDFGQQICNTPTGGGGGAFTGGFVAEKWNPGCYIFDKNSSYCMNISGCSWNTTNCLSNATIQTTGIKCEYINDSTVCNNIPVLPSCCQWQGNDCVTDNFSTSCWSNMQATPTGAGYCEDYDARSSQTLCNQIANYPWFMPCNWDNTTQECKFKTRDIFGAGGTGGFEDLNSKKNCEYAGGQWVEETYCVGTTAVPAGWCEMKFGAGGGKTCDTQCWACEYNDDGSMPTSATTVEDRCKNSKLGACQWRADTLAPDGYGYCELKSDFKFGATDCDSDCWACEKKGNWQSGEDSTPKYHCEHSRASCKWEQDLSTTDTTRGWCMPSTDKTCSQECVKCYDQASCVNSGKGGNACTWDSNSMICKATGTAAGEICFDGMDNDGDSNVDCADKNCMYDPFCGGGMMGNACSQYTDKTLCGQSGCTWKLTTTTTGYCTELGEKCYEYDGNQTGCNVQTGVCVWTAGSGVCQVNGSKAAPCRMKGKTDCQTDANCAWFDDPYCVANPSICSGGWCDGIVEACTMNVSKNTQTACEDANCKWTLMSFFGGSGFGMMTGGGNCEARCNNGSLNSAELCNNYCSYVSGYCNPMGMGTMTGGGMIFGGNCWMYDSNKTGCINKAECSWMPNPQPFCDTNMSIAGCGQFSYNQDTCTNTAGCRWTGTWCDNTLFDCMWNATVSGNETVCKSKSNCQWTASQQRCDLACFGQSSSACTSASLTTICLWKEGFCGGVMAGQMFMNMEAGAPIMLGSDACPEDGVLAALDICDLGVKETKESYIFGARTQSFKNSAVCNGKFTPSGQGSGRNATMYYLYLDTDGARTGGCNSSASAAADKAGYDFMFKYEITWDSTNAQASETKTAYKCINNEWIVTDIKLSSMAEKMCNEINGPMLGISKSDITKLTSLFNLTQSMRVYAVTANSSSNRLSPTDYVGPLYYTSGAADARMENCMLKGADMDGDGMLSEEDPDCEGFTKNGFIKFEDCYSPHDDDGDGLLNCSDSDCRCEESNCADLPICLNLGVNAAGYTDTKSPKIAFYKMDEYVDSALLYYDTDESANGTVLFYGIDTSCTALNATINDVGVWNSNVKKFKGWHEAPFENDGGAYSLTYDLASGTSYYYKMKVCDKSGNCMTSSCMNFTTAASLSNCPSCDFVFKLNVPTGWKVHIDLNKDNVYEIVQGDMCGATAGTLINYTKGKNVSIYLNNSAENSGMYFYSIRLSRAGYNNKVKSMSSSGNLKAGTTTTAGATAGYTGMNAETRDKIINKLHPLTCRVKIPGTGTCTELWHCNDNLTSCVDMSAKATIIETGSNYCLWQIPYCEFSTWSGGKPGTSSTAAASSSSSSKGGGGGGSIIGGTSENPSISYLYEIIIAEKEETIDIDKEGLLLTKLKFILKNNVSDAEVLVEAIPEEQLAVQKLSTPVSQYVKIVKSGIADADVKGVTIHFKVLKEWLKGSNIAKEDVYMMVHNGAAWENAVSTTLETSSSITGAVVGTSGGSSLRKIWDWITFPFKWLKGAITGYAVYAPSDYEYYVAKMGILNHVAITGKTTVIEGIPEAAEEKAAEAAGMPSEEEQPAALEAKTPWTAYVAVIVVLAGVIGAGIYYSRKRNHEMFVQRLEKHIEKGKGAEKKEHLKIETKEVSELISRKKK